MTARPQRLEVSSARQRHHSFGFWVATFAFLLSMAFSAVPTPLYVLYQQRDHFTTFTITVIYAAYAIGVLAALFLGGHVSDWLGRKRVLVVALLANVVSGLLFVYLPSLPGLLVARVVCGLSIGLTTATATAYLSELHLGTQGATGAPRRAQTVAAAANLGGIGFGPLAAGLLAEYAPWPLQLPYVVFIAALLVLTALIALAPETADLPVPAPRYRPQRIAVPRQARRTFFAATALGFAAFAVYGMFNSLAPSFLAETLHETSHALAGVVPFAVFVAGAVAQIMLVRADAQRTRHLGPALLVAGLAVLAAGMWTASLAAFLTGGVIAGAGAGVTFRGALTAAESTAPPESRAEVLAGFFLGVYLGVSLPSVALGVATQYSSALIVMPIFAALVGAAALVCTRLLSSLPR